MKWNKITIDTTVEATDMISYELSEMGIEGIEVEDHVPLTEEERKKMYVDLLPDEIAPNDGKAKISCYIEPEEDLESISLKIREMLSDISRFLDIGAGTLSYGETEDKDWINNWKQFFKPFRLDDTIIIKPTWEKAENVGPDDIIVEIDPGTAFGTGSHETTRLCISQIKRFLKPGAKVLDLGCGSGILSIIALKLGAGSVVGTDIDPNAIIATQENLAVNHVEDGKMTAYEGNLLEDEELCQRIGDGQYDIVVANILADVIIPLSGIARRFMKKDGYFITSGIINTKAEEVEQVMRDNGFTIVDVIPMGEWVSIVGK
ncbi:MAG: 50S ribosomal protein L11 methyltransferase [Lachnospiraceae bacterium]|nr:50S ribosomal protein L11 methyltransferase [Lachnospiraceae bacterium]